MRLSPRSYATTLAGIFVVFGILLGFACINDTDAGQAAPDFVLPDLSGNMVSLKEFRGKVVLVDFWATWCLPCRKTLPELAELDKKYGDNGLVILGLSIDDPSSYDNAYVSKFKDRYNVDYRILRADKDIVKKYLGTDNPRVPTLFIIDKNGKIVKKFEGMKPGEVEEELKKRL